MPLVVQYSGRSGTQLINVVLPYYNRFTTLDRFVSRFTKLVLDGQQHLMLTVVRYTDGFPTMGEDEGKRDHDNVVKCINEANLKMGGGESRIRLVEKHAIFSRGAALMEGARAWDSRQDVILFLCDVDIAFGKSFLQRCRANTQPAQKAYFPVVFSSYNPDIVYSVIKKKPVPVLTNYDRKRLINRDLGYWIDFGFGMSCQYLSDFRRLSGDFLNITGWGLEDVRLYEQFQKSSVGIVRMPDPDLVHVYHKKQCSKYEVGRRFNSCLKSKALNEASRLEWGLWVYKNMGDTDDVREFLKIFQQAQVAGGG
ncbi:chondroitin sulfate N-acetylgalactosaminyltransferase 1-like [Pollicipes pollicipes]|uniref:chondroitin sulfate N-acetylgalactosaminyltransferase 1-like n=1 Tax=Pollicipes pollicipes TaxID=41117 RepID=UPI0018851893|nr:chondroitin sulfate N-acetylgalactosaminyltransferase 1-like [Pollicipes pollicipes]